MKWKVERSNKEMVNAFSKLIESRKWDLFFTTTFRYTVQIDWAKIYFKTFFKYLNTKKKKYYDKSIFCLVFFEKDSSRTGVHIHSLVNGINAQDAVLIQTECKYFLFKKYKGQRWNGEDVYYYIRPFGQTCVRPYSPELKGRFYIAGKYVSRNLVHYDFYRINSRVR